MKLMYPIGTGSKHDNWELRWSLRSAEKFAKVAPEVVLVGEIPDFINRDTTICLDHKNDCPNKHDNMLAHMLHAIDTGVCTDPFLVSSDDHFFVKPVDLDEYPIYIRQGELAREADYGEMKINRYHRSIIDTQKILEEWGFPTRMFNGHFDTWVYPECAETVRKLATVEPRGRYGYEPTALFMNVLLARKALDCVIRRDFKLRKFESIDKLMKDLDERDSFSISDSVFENPEFEKFMNAMYPEKSRYEN